MSNIKLFELSIFVLPGMNRSRMVFLCAGCKSGIDSATDVKDYTKKMKKRGFLLNANWGTICPLVEMEAADGKNRKIQAATRPKAYCESSSMLW